VTYCRDATDCNAIRRPAASAISIADPVGHRALRHREGTSCVVSTFEPGAHRPAPFLVSSCAAMQQSYEENPKALLGGLLGAGAGAVRGTRRRESRRDCGRRHRWSPDRRLHSDTSWTTGTNRWLRKPPTGVEQNQAGQRPCGTIRFRQLRLGHADQDLSARQRPVLPQYHQTITIGGEPRRPTGRVPSSGRHVENSD